MSNWKETVVDLGNIREHSSHNITFHALPTIPAISLIKPACGCTKVNFNADTKELSVLYKSGAIPNQVTGNQLVRKHINIFYKDGTEEILTITAIKLR